MRACTLDMTLEEAYIYLTIRWKRSRRGEEARVLCPHCGKLSIEVEKGGNHHPVSFACGLCGWHLLREGDVLTASLQGKVTEQQVAKISAVRLALDEWNSMSTRGVSWLSLHVAKLTPKKVLWIRRMRRRGMKYKTISELVGVGENTVGDVCRGTKWKHVC